MALDLDFTRVMHDGGSFHQTYSVVNSDNNWAENEDEWNHDEHCFAPEPLGYWQFVGNFTDNIVRGDVDVDKLNLVFFFGHVVGVLMMVDDVL